jgi:hypothetical protein
MTFLLLALIGSQANAGESLVSAEFRQIIGPYLSCERKFDDRRSDIEADNFDLNNSPYINAKLKERQEKRQEISERRSKLFAEISRSCNRSVYFRNLKARVLEKFPSYSEAAAREFSRQYFLNTIDLERSAATLALGKYRFAGPIPPPQSRKLENAKN